MWWTHLFIALFSYLAGIIRVELLTSQVSVAGVLQLRGSWVQINCHSLHYLLIIYGATLIAPVFSLTNELPQPYVAELSPEGCKTNPIIGWFRTQVAEDTRALAHHTLQGLILQIYCATSLLPRHFSTLVTSSQLKTRFSVLFRTTTTFTCNMQPCSSW